MSENLYIIKLTLPSGNSYAFSALEGCLALTPFDEHGAVRKAHAWPSEEEARKYYEGLIDRLPEDMTPFHEMGEVEIVKVLRPQ